MDENGVPAKPVFVVTQEDAIKTMLEIKHWVDKNLEEDAPPVVMDACPKEELIAFTENLIKVAWVVLRAINPEGFDDFDDTAGDGNKEYLN